jgi:hypothetical protein
MRWRQSTEYRTEVRVNDEVFVVVARKEDDDDCFAVVVNNDYIGDTITIPTHEQLVEMIEEHLEIENKVDVGLSRRL